jgi:hypothetical protein
MNPISCPHEAAVSQAAQTGRWDDATRTHSAECVHCGEVAQIAGWLRDVAGIEDGKCVLPNAEQVWLKARIFAIQAAREKALRFLEISELAIRTALILAFAGGIVWFWYRIQTAASNWLSGHWHLPQPIPLTLAALAAGSIILLFLKLYQPILVEE